MSPHALIIGLDGATWDVMDPLLARGELPNMAGLIRRGMRAPLQSTIPPVTAAAWPSIITGVNPGQHGLFRFQVLDHDRYDDSLKFVLSQNLRGLTIFDYAGGLGLRVMPLAVPMTYPAWPVNGKMLAGYPQPDWQAFYTYPPEWADDVARHIRWPHREPGKESSEVGSAELFIRESQEMMEQWGSYQASLLKSEAPDLAMFVFPQTDQVQHYFFDRHAHAIAPDDPVDQVYRMADVLVGKLLGSIDEQWLVILVSDHGGGPRARRLFQVNEWLRQHGLLTEATHPGETLARAIFPVLKAGTRIPGALPLWYAIGGGAQRSLRKVQAAAGRSDWAASRAYFVRLCPPVGGINLNLAGREPNGIVEPGAEYEVLRDEILKRLDEIVDPETNTRVIVNAWRREELYTGDYLDAAPDIIFQTDSDHEARTGLGMLWGNTSDVLRRELTGDHRMNGILAMAGRGVIRPNTSLQNASVLDVAPTLLYAMGLAVPANMDGRIIEEAFEPAYLTSSPKTSAPHLTLSAGSDVSYSPEEEAGIASALRALGYVE